MHFGNLRIGSEIHHPKTLKAFQDKRQDEVRLRLTVAAHSWR
jgi:hypothetical protein